MADEHFVFEDNAGTEERVRPDLAPLANYDAGLDLDERADAGFPAEAHIAVDVRGRMDVDAVSESHAGGSSPGCAASVDAL